MQEQGNNYHYLVTDETGVIPETNIDVMPNVGTHTIVEWFGYEFKVATSMHTVRGYQRANHRVFEVVPGPTFRQKINPAIMRSSRVRINRELSRDELFGSNHAKVTNLVLQLADERVMPSREFDALCNYEDAPGELQASATAALVHALRDHDLSGPVCLAQDLIKNGRALRLAPPHAVRTIVQATVARNYLSDEHYQCLMAGAVQVQV